MIMTRYFQVLFTCAMLLLPVAESGATSGARQKRANSVEAYLYDTAGDSTNVRLNPNGKVKVRLTRDVFIPCFQLADYNNGWWHVVACSDAEGTEEADAICSKAVGGYIHYSCVAVESSNYGQQTIGLRAKPSAKSKVLWSTKEVIVLRPTGVSRDGKWWRVKTEDGKHEGWIQVEWLCLNPLTNCS